AQPARPLGPPARRRAHCRAAVARDDRSFGRPPRQPRGAAAMIRLASLFWLALVCATGFATFKVKYAVQDFEEELNRVRKHTVVEHQEIHLLRAEWTTLNQPERLADLNRRYLSLAAIAPKQLQGTIDTIPLRPAPAPPDTLIAAAPTSPAVTPVSA